MEQFFEKVKVHVTEIKETDGDPIVLDRDPGVFEMLEMIHSLSIKDQIYMMCNLLTLAGYTQEVIANTLGVTHQTYRNRLLEIRKELQDKEPLIQ